MVLADRWRARCCESHPPSRRTCSGPCSRRPHAGVVLQTLAGNLEQDAPSLESLLPRGRLACIASSSVDNAKYQLAPNPHLSQNPASAVMLILQPCHEETWVWNILRRAAEPVLWKCLLGNDDTDIFLEPADQSIAEPAAEASHRLSPAVWDFNRHF